MYINYFNALKTTIKSNLNSVKTVNWYNNQYDRFEELQSIALPAVYIEFPPIQWQTNGDGLQTAETEIILHLVVVDLKDTPEKNLQLGQSLHAIIQGSELMEGNTQISTKLVRSESDLMTDYDQVKVLKLSYKTTLYDYTTVKQYVAVNPVGVKIVES